MNATTTVRAAAVLLLAVLLPACGGDRPAPAGETAPAATAATEGDVQKRLEKYAPVRLTTDLTVLTENERRMLPLLLDAAQAMDDLFWLQAYGDRNALLGRLSDPAVRRFAEINYGPWDRLDGDAPFVPGVGEKPATANFYPHDLTKEEFEKALAADPSKAAAFKSEYTVIRRQGPALVAVPYHEEWKEPLERAAARLEEAAKLAEDPGLANYLALRARALRTGEYRDSDRAWLDMKGNTIDVVIGPIETYEDKLFGYKAAAEAYVLVKDKEWSKRLAKYAAMLPELQQGLPVPAEYKKETPGTDSDLNAYDALYYAGDCNAGSKTIAINLPNDEQVQLEKGTRRLQLKNAMRAKFDKILRPIAEVVIAPEQRRHVTFDAFFSDVMFHEVAHGLGIKSTINGKGTVREALKEAAGSLEEGKADILGLYMITKLHEKGELGPAALEDYYVTFLAGIFRSVRFGASSAHGVANLARFNFFKQQGAFTRRPDGTFAVDMEKMRQAMNALSEKILRLQGDGDYDGVVAFHRDMGTMDADLKGAIAEIGAKSIPTDVVFEQGASVLGL